MKLKVIGSSSSGNCYILKPTDGGKMLIIEAGLNMKEVGKMITYQWHKIAGVIITHEHQDHAAYAADFQARGVKVYATSETAARINNQVLPLQFISKKNMFQLGDFKIMWFDTVHDAAHPVGYFIQHAEMGKMLFITDTAEITQKFRGVNHLCIETNYDPNHPAFAKLSESYTNRVLLSHLSIDQAEKFIKNNLIDKDKLESVTLLHLSSRHADKQDFPKRIKKTLSKLGRDIPVEVAQPFSVFNLNQYENPNF